MESSEASSFASFKSKKVLHSTVKSPFSGEAPKASDQTVWSLKTPEKPINPPRRTRNSRTALSLKDVRQAAMKLRKPGPDIPNRPDPLTSSSQPISASNSESPVAKSRKNNPPAKLPEKYEILDKFFNSLDSSIRLLRLKGSMSTFTNISPKIECLTDRRFSYVHLAQLKYILPEAIEIKKILIRDERTCCMKPDLQITLNADAIKSEGKSESDRGGLNVRKVFRSRLLDFFKKNPEVEEVPEEELPYPFTQSNQGQQSNSIANSNSLLTQTSAASTPGQKTAPASHLSRTFRRHFAKQISSPDVVQLNQEAPTPIKKIDLEKKKVSSPDVVQLNQELSTPIKTIDLEKKKVSSSDVVQLNQEASTPIKKIDPEKKEDLSAMDNVSVLGTPVKLVSTPVKLVSTTPTASIQGTPAKLVSTPVRLMSTTPAQKPQKRALMSPDDDSVRPPNTLARRPTIRRSIFADDDIYSILPKNLLDSISEKGRKALEEKDPAISQAKWRQQMIASLPKLFDMLLFLFQSINRSVFTKNELVQKIISSHLEIVDRREVDEQLRLLQELVPEWIQEKSASTGDLLFCINKLSCPESIRTKLAGAK